MAIQQPQEMYLGLPMWVMNQTVQYNKEHKDDDKSLMIPKHIKLLDELDFSSSLNPVQPMQMLLQMKPQRLHAGG
jgi:hypothetical protein